MFPKKTCSQTRMKTNRKTHRQLQKEDTRRIILRSAYTLFAKKGYAKTTMRTLAEHAGIGLGTIFKHFPDKPSILAAAFEEDLNAVLVDAFKTLPTMGLASQLIHITERIYSFYAANTAFSKALIQEVLFLEGEHGEVLHKQLQAFLGEIAHLIEKAVINEELPPNTKPMDGALAYWSFYFTGLLMGLTEPSFNIPAQLAMVRRLIDDHFFKEGSTDYGSTSDS